MNLTEKNYFKKRNEIITLLVNQVPIDIKY